MTFEIAAQRAEFQKFFSGKQPGFGPRGIKDRSGMTFGKNETVVVVMLRILGVIAHVSEEKGCHQVCHGAAGRGVTAAGGGGGVDGVDAQRVRDPFQQFDVSFNH